MPGNYSGSSTLITTSTENPFKNHVCSDGWESLKHVLNTYLQSENLEKTPGVFKIATNLFLTLLLTSHYPRCRKQGSGLTWWWMPTLIRWWRCLRATIAGPLCHYTMMLAVMWSWSKYIWMWGPCFTNITTTFTQGFGKNNYYENIHFIPNAHIISWWCLVVGIL